VLLQALTAFYHSNGIIPDARRQIFRSEMAGIEAMQFSFRNVV
jgi:hypothetical protein